MVKGKGKGKGKEGWGGRERMEVAKRKGGQEAVFIGLRLLWACGRPGPFVSEAAVTGSVYCSEDSTYPLVVLPGIVDTWNSRRSIVLD